MIRSVQNNPLRTEQILNHPRILDHHKFEQTLSRYTPFVNLLYQSDPFRQKKGKG